MRFRKWSKHAGTGAWARPWGFASWIGVKRTWEGQAIDIRVQKYYKLNNSSFAVKHRAWIFLSSGVFAVTCCSDSALQYQ